MTNIDHLPLVTQAVNDTNPTFFYCGTPTHCEKGMFGVINPPNAWQQPSSAGMMMSSLANQYSSTKAAMSYASNATSSQPYAASWGMGIDMSQMPSWAQSYAAENIAFTQSFLAMNPETMNAQGVVDLSPLANNAIMMPTDVAAAARQNDAQSSSTPSSSSAAASSTTAAAAASTSSGSSSSNGAGALSSPRVAVALVAVAAAFFAL